MGIAEQIERRRRAAADAWDLRDELVLVGAGQPVPYPGRGDRTYPFRSHAEYLYLTDRERPGGVLAFDPAEGWSDFVAPVTVDERLWEGAPDDGQDGVPLPELAGWLERRSGRAMATLGAPHGAGDAALTDRVRLALDAVRRPKDPVEIERMRAAGRATRDGFAALARLIQPGRTERELQIELEAAFYRGGADALAFDSIVAGGPNSAVLHFPPTGRALEAGELLLVDAGGEYRGYAGDVTRTYPVGGDFTGVQAELYAIVRDANRHAQTLCRPGTEWVDVHWAAARVIAEGLAGLGVLRGDVDGLVERRTVSLFFPHGVGHMVGLGVRDAGGALAGRTPRDDFPRLRIDLPLEPGFAVTVEPGIYFVPALLQDPERRAQHRDAVDWDRADALLGFGGIRVEDDMLVTDGEPENLTAAIPLLGG
jgi:Xaa-Pro aminopeptidase